MCKPLVNHRSTDANPNPNPDASGSTQHIWMLFDVFSIRFRLLFPTHPPAHSESPAPQVGRTLACVRNLEQPEKIPAGT